MIDEKYEQFQLNSYVSIKPAGKEIKKKQPASEDEEAKNDYLTSPKGGMGRGKTTTW